MFSHFGLLQFWFTNEFSEAALLFFCVFYEIFNFSSENWPNHWDIRWILLNLLVLSAEFNLTLSTKLGKVFSYNSWAVLDIPYSSLHLSNSPNIYWMPASHTWWRLALSRSSIKACCPESNLRAISPGFALTLCSCINSNDPLSAQKWLTLFSLSRPSSDTKIL